MPFCYTVLNIFHWLWGLPQNFAGLLISLLFSRRIIRRERFRSALISFHSPGSPLAQLGSFSLGMFIFTSFDRADDIRSKIIVHEYGHTVQSLILGPLYLPAIGLPSALWARRFTKNISAYRARGVRYSSRFPEKSASALGQRVCKSPALDW